MADPQPMKFIKGGKVYSTSPEKSTKIFTDMLQANLKAPGLDGLEVVMPFRLHARLYKTIKSSTIFMTLFTEQNQDDERFYSHNRDVIIEFLDQTNAPANIYDLANIVPEEA